MNRLLVLMLIIVFGSLYFSSCSGKSEEEQWWKSHLSDNESVIGIYFLHEGQSIMLDIDGNGLSELGLLLKEGFEIHQKKKASKSNVMLHVVLMQESTKKYIGTYYSASNRFDLSKGQRFELLNKTGMDVNLVVFRLNDKD